MKIVEVMIVKIFEPEAIFTLIDILFSDMTEDHEIFQDSEEDEEEEDNNMLGPSMLQESSL